LHWDGDQKARVSEYQEEKYFFQRKEPGETAKETACHRNVDYDS
jgi:hypothetical protein